MTNPHKIPAAKIDCRPTSGGATTGYGDIENVNRLQYSMKSKARKCIASFTVKEMDNEQATHELFVCQDATLFYRGTEQYRKRLFLHSSEGEEVYVTTTPDVYTTAEGVLLKRRDKSRPPA